MYVAVIKVFDVTEAWKLAVLLWSATCFHHSNFCEEGVSHCAPVCLCALLLFLII